MPEELLSYFEKKYSELKGKAKTYGELKNLIAKESKEVCFIETCWGDLLHEQLNKLLENEVNSLPIIEDQKKR